MEFQMSTLVQNSPPDPPGQCSPATKVCAKLHPQIPPAGSHPRGNAAQSLSPTPQGSHCASRGTYE